MSVYTVHAPAATGEETDRFVFVRDGFHVWAMVLGPLWLVWHRLWLALIGYLVLAAGLGVTLALVGAGSSARFLVFALLALLMGLEGASLRRWTYSRGAWRQVDFVVADDEEAAEQRFFDRWTDDRAVDGGFPHDPAAPAPYRSRSVAATPNQAHPDQGHGVIGLFPEPGGAR
jgi:hypothetical protein